MKWLYTDVSKYSIEEIRELLGIEKDQETNEKNE